MRKIFLLYMLLLLAACGTPSDILPKDKMEAVLWDIAKGGEFLNAYVAPQHPDLNRAALNQKVLNEIFRIHKITKKDFDKSLDYYQRKSSVFVDILDSITATQNREKERLRKQDSLSASKPSPVSPERIAPKIRR